MDAAVVMSRRGATVGIVSALACPRFRGVFMVSSSLLSLGSSGSSSEQVTVLRRSERVRPMLTSLC